LPSNYESIKHYFLRSQNAHIHLLPPALLLNHHDKMASNLCPYHRDPQTNIPPPAYNCVECDYLASLLPAPSADIPSRASPPPSSPPPSHAPLTLSQPPPAYIAPGWYDPVVPTENRVADVQAQKKKKIDGGGIVLMGILMGILVLFSIMMIFV
jgi:hypothetical protein